MVLSDHILRLHMKLFGIGWVDPPKVELRILRDKAIIVTLAEPDGGCKFTFLEGKTGMSTVVLIRSSSYIDHWIRTHPRNDKKNEPLWIALDGKGYRQLDRLTIYGTVQRVAKKAGINKRIHPHLFRHTRATQLIRFGWSEPKVKRYLGWADGSNVPGLYIHLGEDALSLFILL